ncbi:CoA transferase [Nocardia sp. NEAU-G5]|uniref:CoA transferase n=1 Tax=Nocardia albiluteola TaxID=2842303 RepID=A0ABS6ATE3_9NOCA|nr:CoA transferase [Nocardia albiluteola]MBU3060284.1 CoA transferase [Nocardia albiluteola]
MDVISSQTPQDASATDAGPEGVAASLAGIFGTDVGPVRIVGADPLTPSVHRLGDASAAAIAAFGQQIAALAGKTPVTVHTDAAIDQLRAAFLTTLNGQGAHGLAEDPAALGNNNFYAARDNRWIFLITTFPHQRDAVCRVLNTPPFADRIAEATAHWDAFALEDAVCAAGGVAAVVRSADEWRSLPVGRDSMAHPVVRIDRIGEAEPRPLPGALRWPPLQGLRMVDLTHVIAGPVATKLLATFGADVLHVSRPDLPDPVAMIALTGGGKRNAYCDVRDPNQAARLREIAGAADVFVDSYRGMAARGFAAHDLAAANPGIVTLEYHCWGADGPWAARGGFDQLACSATGFALEEAVDGRPSLPPTYLLNDYLAAYLGAAGTVAALRRRAVEGGSWRVRVDLARVCTWVQDLGSFAPERIRSLPRPGAASVPVHTVRGPLGTLVEPEIPIEFSGLPTPTPGAPALLGTSPLRW